MKNAQYVIAERKTVRSQGGVVGFTYNPDLRFGRFESVKAAKAALMKSLYPDLKNADANVAAKHFDQQMRNSGHFKVFKDEGAARQRERGCRHDGKGCHWER